MIETPMAPMLEFVDCAPRQIGDRIEEMMQGRPAITIVVRKTDEVSILGTYEGVNATEVLVETDGRSQELARIPLAEVAMFGIYMPPLDLTDEIGFEHRA